MKSKQRRVLLNKNQDSRIIDMTGKSVPGKLHGFQIMGGLANKIYKTTSLNKESHSQRDSVEAFTITGYPRPQSKAPESIKKFSIKKNGFWYYIRLIIAIVFVCAYIWYVILPWFFNPYPY